MDEERKSDQHGGERCADRSHESDNLGPHLARELQIVGDELGCRERRHAIHLGLDEVRESDGRHPGVGLDQHVAVVAGQREEVREIRRQHECDRISDREGLFGQSDDLEATVSDPDRVTHAASG